jgi:hypothetical protein
MQQIPMGFTRPHSRQVAHVYYQLFDSRIADGDQLWSVSKLENDILRRNASKNGRKLGWSKNRTEKNRTDNFDTFLDIAFLLLEL